MVVQHNLSAMNANRMLNLTVKSQAGSTEKLSSGYRINRAADDAAGLSISEKMRKQIRGLTQASSNAQDGISMVQTAEGALGEVHDMLQRMNELAVKAANGTLSEDDRQYIQNEVDQIMLEIDRVKESTKFNEIYVLKGGYELSDETKAFQGKISKELVGSNPELFDNHVLGTYTYAQVLQKLGLPGDTAEIPFNTTELEGGKFDSGSRGAGFLDLTNIKTEEDVAKLIGCGVSITCGACTGFFGLKFVDNDPSFGLNSDGYKYVANDSTVSSSPSKPGQNIWIDISGCKNGEEIVKKVMNVFASKDAEATATGVSGTAYYMGLKGSTHHVGIVGNGSVLCMFDSTRSNGMSPEAEDYMGMGAFANGWYGKTRGPIINTEKVNLHVGADATSNNQIEVPLGNISTVAIGLMGYEFDWRTETGKWVNYADVTTAEKALRCIDAVKDAIQEVSTQRSRFGAIQNRLEHTINNLDNVVENTTSAESSIRDTDMATEMVRYSNNNILAQAGQAMLAQANQGNQGVLSLLQ